MLCLFQKGGSMVGLWMAFIFIFYIFPHLPNIHLTHLSSKSQEEKYF